MEKIPTHVAIIMDGNRRWAAKRGLGPVDGHRVAAEKTLRPIVEHAIKRGIKYLTFWAFSTENRKRDKEELEGLFGIFREGLQKELRELQEMGVRVRIIGDIDWFPQDIAKPTKKVVEDTRKNTKITVTFALNYGGREEILHAVNKLLRDRKQAARSDPSRMTENRKQKNGEISEGEFAQYLDTTGMPDPDLLIRTSGEQRTSGYLAWQAVYSELYFTPVFWPDFSPKEFDRALQDYSQRNRRFGA